MFSFAVLSHIHIIITGTAKHLSDMPLRYFTELLNQGKRLVFTGEIQYRI